MLNRVGQQPDQCAVRSTKMMPALGVGGSGEGAGAMAAQKPSGKQGLVHRRTPATSLPVLRGYP